jgi:ribonuclease III
MEEALVALETKLGYRFRDRELLQRALTHRSRAFEGTAEETSIGDNEQMEFLGDAILGFIVSEVLVARHPGFPEGRLSKLKAYLVSANYLHEAACDLELGDHLFLGRGEELSGGRGKRALLANAMEALMAAIYLDGGIDAVRPFVMNQVLRDFDSARGEDETLVVDYKSALQELTQVMGLPMPRYSVVREEGPEHRKTFTVEARVGQECLERADGTSKKAAGQRAAQQLLDVLNAHHLAAQAIGVAAAGTPGKP